ncbi:unnamed protein product [Closterium sp. NIES-64]|nr:unnamed protein product [Closterium sp. NIES-64]
MPWSWEPSPLVPHPSPPQRPPSLSQQSSGPAASSPVVASPALTSAPITASGSHSPPLPVPPQPVSPAGAHVVPPLPHQMRVAADLPSEHPQRQHPLVSLDPTPVARFPPPGPRAQSPPLSPDAPDAEDDKKWWNGELWESPPMSGRPLEQLHACLEARNFVLRDPQLTEQRQGVAS